MKSPVQFEEQNPVCPRNRNRIIPRRIMKIAISILMVVGCYTIASAGEIFGTIKTNGKSVGKRVKLEISSAQKACSIQTNNYGSFHCFLQEKGKCKLTMHYEKDSPSLE